jgi:hypothetical protein
MTLGELRDRLDKLSYKNFSEDKTNDTVVCSDWGVVESLADIVREIAQDGYSYGCCPCCGQKMEEG